nr:steroid receptor-associated and regulated protein-like [Equus asinus]
MATSEDPKDQRASPKVVGLETSSSGKQTRHQKAIPTAHPTFIIHCAPGKQLSLESPSVPLQAPTTNLGPVTPPMKTYVFFCGENQPCLTQEAPPCGGCLAQAKSTFSLCGGTVAPASSPVSPLCHEEVPEAKGSPLKTVSEGLQLGE